MDKIQIAVLKQKLQGLLQHKQIKEAAGLAQAILQADPNDHQVWYVMAQIQLNLGALQNAVQAFQRSLHPKAPFYLNALSSIVGISVQLKAYDEGLEYAKKWATLAPESKDANYLCGYLAWNGKHLNTAVSHLEKALSLDSSNAEITNILGEVYNLLGKHERSRQMFEKALTLTDYSDSVSVSHIMAVNYHEDLSDDDVFAAHKRFGDVLESRYPQPLVEALPNPKRDKIKVAYLSADFRRHSVAYFFLPLIESIDKNRFEIVCYSNTTTEDDLSAKIKAQASLWKQVAAMSDEQLANEIKNDEIDILVDLGGYSGDNPRMPVFAMKPAPIQMTYLGYANTSGLSRMDYRLVDHITDPQGRADEINTETLLRFKQSFLCYDPIDDYPEIAERDPDAPIVFGSFNAYAKISDRMLEAWAKILSSVENAKLLLKAEVFMRPDSAPLLLDRMANMGIDEDRFILVGHKPDRLTHLQEYNRVDIHLDTFPYNGTTTTFEAAWMGVPTVTLPGESHRSRVGASIMSAMGLEDFVAKDLDAYVDIAVTKAKEIAAQSDYKQTLRQRLNDSCLMDAKSFVSELEQFYEQAYQAKRAD